jgi:hypothetical protein
MRGGQQREFNHGNAALINPQGEASPGLKELLGPSAQHDERRQRKRDGCAIGIEPREETGAWPKPRARVAGWIAI